jgi:hypothetical protein
MNVIDNSKCTSENIRRIIEELPVNGSVELIIRSFGTIVISKKPVFTYVYTNDLNLNDTNIQKYIDALREESSYAFQPDRSYPHGGIRVNQSDYANIIRRFIKSLLPIMQEGGNKKSKKRSKKSKKRSKKSKKVQKV